LFIIAVGPLAGVVLESLKSSYVNNISTSVFRCTGTVETVSLLAYDPCPTFRERCVSLIQTVFSTPEPPIRALGEKSLTAKPTPYKNVVTDPVFGALRLESAVLIWPSYVKLRLREPTGLTNPTVIAIENMACTPCGMTPMIAESLFQTDCSQFVPENLTAGVYIC
jgi:hypothetical protein